MNGRNESVRGRILKKQEGNLEDVLNATTYKKIIPTAKNLNEALAFVRQLYQSTEGKFTAYEFEIESEKETDNRQQQTKVRSKPKPL